MDLWNRCINTLFNNKTTVYGPNLARFWNIPFTIHGLHCRTAAAEGKKQTATARKCEPLTAWCVYAGAYAQLRRIARLPLIRQQRTFSTAVYFFK